MKPNRRIIVFITSFLLIFTVGIVIAQTIADLRATSTARLVTDNNNNGLADGGDVIEYTVNIANCSPNVISGMNYQSDIDPNTVLIPNSIQVTTQGTGLCGGGTVDNPPPAPTTTPPPTPVNPIVTTTTPADNATEVAVDSNISITFSEDVIVAGDWFELVCTTSGTFNLSSANIAVTGGPATFTLDPNVDLQVGETCVVTVFTTGVTDSEGLNPLADYVFSFETETPPTVDSTNPANGATDVATNADIIIVFDEPVTVSAASFSLECPNGTPFGGGYAVSGSGTNTITINPTGNLPAGTVCEVTAIASGLDAVIDLNGNALDGNDDLTPGDDYVFTFTTIFDAAPFVATIDPADGAVSVPNTTNITITFSESVDIAGPGDFNLECGGNPQGYTITTPATLPASTTTIVIDPTVPLPDATVCTVTVFSSIEDTDMDDPPDTMGANFVSTFTTEAPPSVTTTNPLNGATGIATSANIVIDFDEPVDVTPASFTIECPIGSPFGYTVSGGGTNSITLDPNTNLPANQTCTVTVLNNLVSDSDPIDPPNNMLANYVFSFDTVADTAPIASSPLDGATGVATSTNIVINFNEPVDVTAGAFDVTCGVTPISFTVIPALPTTNQNSITLDPTFNLPATTTCTVSVFSANVTDTDTDEPPNNMAADYIFNFTTIVDLAPTVNQPAIAPASTSTGANSASLNNPVSTTPTITIPFNEAVDVAAGAFALVCNATPVGVNVTPALPAVGATSFNISPSVPLGQGANCVLTVVAANVTDSDTDDPPNNMATDFAISFAVDTAPAEVLTETEVGGVFQDVTGLGANNVDLDTNIQITFNEAVNVTFPANGLQCPGGVNIPVTVTTNNATTIVLNPNINLPLNTLCVLNIPAANISDVDTADAPDVPVAGVNHTFTTADDDAPRVTTNPTAGGTNIAVNANITVNFNEAVTLTGAWFTLDCTVSGTRVSTGELTGTGITIIEDTPDLVYIIDPAVDFAVGDVCTITIDSANVVDNDIIDPPNNLDGNADFDVLDDADDYVAVFSTTDVAPQVTSTTPTNTATVGANQAVTLNFSEPVDIGLGAFTFACNATPITGGFNTSVSLPANAVTTITLTPVNPLPFGANCVVTAESTLITDDDPVDPPNELDGDNSNDIADADADDFVLNFTVDAQATENTTQIEIGNVLSPASGAVNVDIDTNIVVTFSEAVNAGLTSFTLDCGGAIAFTVSGTGTDTITVDPTPATLPINTLCTFDIIAANITDVDANDPPDVLDSDVTYTFTTINDAPPTVTSAEAEVTNVFTALSFTPPTYADRDTNLRITFSEAVTVTGNWASLTCTVSGTQSVALGLGVTDADPVYTLNPATNLTPGEDCTLTIFASQVADEDALIQNMTANAVFTFTVQDTAPRVVSTVPAISSTTRNNQTVTLDFTEAVDIAAGGIVWTCGTPVAFTPALPLSNVTSVVLTPTGTLAPGICTVLLVSTAITDVDTIDSPNELDGDYSGDIVDGDADNFVLPFTVDAPPRVTNNVPANGATDVAITNNIVIDFSENVNIIAGGITLDCGAGALPFAPILPIGPVTSININPDSDLPNGAVCTVTVVASDVTDADAFDPPNQLDGDNNGVEGDNFVFSFTTIDTAPRVVSIVPAISSTTPNNQTVTLNFSEAVDIQAGAIAWSCAPGFTPALPVTNVTSIVLTPTGTLTGGFCSVTLTSTAITDVDTVDGPNELDGNNDFDITNGDADDYSSIFFVDTPPQVSNATVNVGGTPQFLPLAFGQFADVGTNIVVNFNENINATVGGVTLECDSVAVPFSAGLPVTGVSTITVNPTSDLPSGATCLIRMIFTEISDTDAFDPPNLLDGNFDQIEGPSIGFTFQTQAAAIDDAYTVTPHLTYTSPTGVRANDTPASVTITGFGDTLATANGTVPNGTNFITAGGAGGRVYMNADGTFVFYPDAGDNNASGVVTFFYTITGGDTAQVTLTFEAEEFIWFVDGSGASTVCTTTNVGTQACPATDILLVAAMDTPSDIIFVADGNYSCGVVAAGTTLENNQWVIGDGASSTLAALVASRVSPVPGSNFAPYNTFSGTDPVFNAPSGDCFTYTNNNEVRGLRIDNTTGYAISSAVNIGTSAATEVNITGPGGIIELIGGGTFNGSFETLSSSSFAGIPFTLVNMGGTITNTGGVITNNFDADTIVVSGGSVNMTLRSSVSKTGGLGSMISIGGGHTGTLNFESALSKSGGGGTGVTLNNGDGTYNFNGVFTITAASAGVNIQNGSAGTVNFANAGSSITGVSGISFIVLDSTGNVSYPGTITQTSGGNVVQIINTSGNTVTFGGTITQNVTAGQGIFINNMAGTTTFTTLNLGSAGTRFNNTAITIFNSTGTVNLGAVSAFSNNFQTMTATNNDGTINSTSGEINATNARAINIGGPVGLTTLGMTLTQVSSTNSTNNGINIQNTNGSFTVTGDGNSATHTNGAGGTISNTTAEAVFLSNVTNITLNDMIINTTGSHGFNGTNVNGLVLDNVDMTDIGDGDNEYGLNFTTGAGANLVGTVILDNVTMTRVAEHMVYIENFSGALTMTVTNSTFEDTITPLVCGGNNCDGMGLLLRADGASSMDVVIQNNQFNRIDGFGISANPEGNSGAVMEIDIIDNSFTANVYGGFSNTNNGESAISLRNAQGNGTMRFDIDGNIITNYTGELALGVIEVEAGDFTVNNGAIQFNTINHAYDGNAIQVFVDALPTVVGGSTNALLNVRVASNTIPNTAPIFGTSLLANNNGATTLTQNGTLNIIATGNNFNAVATAASRRTITINVRDRNSTCMNIVGNTLAAGTGGTQPSINVSYNGTGVVRLQGMPGTGDASAIAYLNATNTLAVGAISGPNDNITSASCTVPSYP